MSVLLSIVIALNLLILIEVSNLVIREQEARGLNVGYGRTVIFYVLAIGVLAAIIYFAAQFFGLG